MKKPGIGDGFMLVDKDRGWTSHDVVAKVRSLVGGKVGHAGTLDPMATGLLILGLGRSTRLLRYVQGFPKEYRATAQLGVATDSLDADGAVLERSPLPVSANELDAVLDRFRGTIMQTPPMVSARKVGGKRLYELARAGEVVEREARPVEVYSLEIADLTPSQYPEVTFDVVCSTGTYVRTLADDIARALGGRAHLTALRRVRNGTVSVGEATRVDAVEAAVRDQAISDLVADPADVLSSISERVVDPAFEFRARNGAAIPLDALHGAEPIAESELVRVVADGILLGIYRIDGPVAKPEVITA